MNLRSRVTLLITIFVMVLSQAGCNFLQSVTQIGQEITVIIDGCNAGSGVIFRKEQSTYYVLTAKHVVNTEFQCLVITPDEQRHRLGFNDVELIKDVDLAVIRFESTNKYQVGKFGKLKLSSDSTGKKVYVAGAPEPNETQQYRNIRVNEGKITGISERGQQGYNLIYNNVTRPGMSGGAVLDSQGRIIGIHGRGDYSYGIKSGENYGIPIQTFLRLYSAKPTNKFKLPDLPKITINQLKLPKNYNPQENLWLISILIIVLLIAWILPFLWWGKRLRIKSKHWLENK